MDHDWGYPHDSGNPQIVNYPNHGSGYRCYFFNFGLKPVIINYFFGDQVQMLKH